MSSQAPRPRQGESPGPVLNLKAAAASFIESVSPVLLGRTPQVEAMAIRSKTFRLIGERGYG
eukprot:1920995-Rhodomonas_salina.1